MKELSIEEKAKAYDEKLDVARHIYADPSVKDEDKYYIEVIFPELSEESEDERIRKDIIATIHLYYGEPLEDEAKEMIAWLENLCEHKKFRDAIQVGDKVTRNEDGVLVNLSQLNRVAKPADKQGEQKPIDKVEPKFKEGDTIQPKDRGHEPWQIMQVDILDKKYRFKDGYVIHFSQEDNYELVEQKPAWSEEDEYTLGETIQHLEELIRIEKVKHCGIDVQYYQRDIDWLKSLKERVQPQQEWSDVDKNILFRTIDSLKFLKDTISTDPNYAVNIIDIEREITWLKSLRPQKKETLPQWRRLPLNGVSYAPDSWRVMDVITSTVGANSASVSALVKGGYYVPLFELEKFIRNI